MSRSRAFALSPTLSPVLDDISFCLPYTLRQGSCAGFGVVTAGHRRNQRHQQLAVPRDSEPQPVSMGVNQTTTGNKCLLAGGLCNRCHLKRHR